MSLFIMVSVNIMVSANCFGKELVQVGKFIFAVSTKNLQTFNYQRLFSLTF